jgi:hypothetical protein
MLITKPLPEEFSPGHLGRLMRINCIPSQRAGAYKVLRAATSQTGEERPESPLHSVAKLLEIDAADYATQHTLMPFHSFAFQSDKDGHCSQWRQPHFRRFGFSAINPHALFCPDCVKEDEAFWGFSYWRREHQILGMRWCARHQRPLMYTSGSDAFFRPPSEWLSYATPYMDDLPNDAANSPLALYQQMVALMLEHGAPESLSKMRDHIAWQAQKNGLVLSECARGHRLTSDRIFRTFPRKWLAEVFPRSRNKQLGQFCSVFDNALKPVRSGMVGAPAMACTLVALFNDPEIAIRTICSNQAAPARHSDAIKPLSGDHVASCPEEEMFSRVAQPEQFSSRALARIFLKCQGDLTAIASELKLNEPEVRWLFAKRRSHVMSLLRKSHEASILNIFFAGGPLIETSLIHDVPFATFEALLRYFNNQLVVPKETRFSAATTKIAVPETLSIRRLRKAKGSPGDNPRLH